MSATFLQDFSLSLVIMNGGCIDVRSLEWKCEVCGVPNRELLSSGTVNIKIIPNTFHWYVPTMVWCTSFVSEVQVTFQCRPVDVRK